MGKSRVGYLMIFSLMFLDGVNGHIRGLKERMLGLMCSRMRCLLKINLLSPFLSALIQDLRYSLFLEKELISWFMLLMMLLYRMLLCRMFPKLTWMLLRETP